MIKRGGDRAAGMSGQDLRLAYHRTAVVEAVSVWLRAGEVTALVGPNGSGRSSLRFVEQRQVHRLPDGIWTFGGPLYCQQYVDAIVAAYAG